MQKANIHHLQLTYEKQNLKEEQKEACHVKF